MLSSLYGIGVILLNPENLSESEMMLPSKSRAEVNWQSVNRILTENSDSSIILNWYLLIIKQEELDPEIGIKYEKLTMPSGPYKKLCQSGKITNK